MFDYFRVKLIFKIISYDYFIITQSGYKFFQSIEKV